MTGTVVGVAIALVFGLLAVFGERVGTWLADRRLSRHTCHITCHESWSCKCGCRDGLYGRERETCCWLCGTQYVGEDPEAYDGPYNSGHVNMRWTEKPWVQKPNEITQELPAPKGFTSWGWERDREFRKSRRNDEGG